MSEPIASTGPGRPSDRATMRVAAAQLGPIARDESRAEVVERLHLPFAILSDAGFRLADALRLPCFEVHGTRLLRRLTMVLSQGRIEKVFYPVFPPDRSAGDVVAWLRAAQR